MAGEKKEPDADNLDFSRHPDSPIPSNKKVLLVGSVITVALIVDVLITWLFDIVDVTLQRSTLGMVIFVASIAVIHGVGQYYLLSVVRHATRQVRKKVALYDAMFWSVVGIEVILAGVFLLIILEISVYASYHTAWVVAATALSMGVAATVMAFQSYTLFSWFKIHTKNLVIMVYALAPALAAAGVGLGVFRSLLRLLEGPELISQTDNISFQLISSFGPYQSLFYLSVILLLFSYMLFWISSVLHLREYGKKKSGFKYWLLAFIPAVAFPMTLVISIGAEASVSSEDSTQPAPAILPYRLVAVSSALASFIMNAFVYFVISRTVQATAYGRKKLMHQFLLFAGFGTMTLGISIAVPTFSTYPPFESVPRSFMPVAAYLYSIGLFSSAISLAEDAKLRQSVRKLAFESSLLDGIGKAQMQKELQGKVLTIVKDHSEALEKSGIESSLAEDDLKRYLEQVVEELGSTKKASQREKE